MIGVIISTSSTELRFLRPQLRECLKFSKHVYLTIASHRFDGIHEEPIDEFQQIAAEFPEVTIIRYQVLPPDGFDNPLKVRPGAYWHNISRIVGTKYLIMKDAMDECRWLMYLDGDEIPDGTGMAAWRDSTLRLQDGQSGMYLANYWYFREPVYRAKSLEASVPVVPRSIFTDEDSVVGILMHDWERCSFQGVLHMHQYVVPQTSVPLIHHFSWVRSKEDILRKVATWGHSQDKPWAQLIEDTWDKPFDGRDFVHGYEYDVVDNAFGV